MLISFMEFNRIETVEEPTISVGRVHFPSRAPLPQARRRAQGPPLRERSSREDRLPERRRGTARGRLRLRQFCRLQRRGPAAEPDGRMGAGKGEERERDQYRSEPSFHN